MRNAGKIAVLCVAMFSLATASGCQKKFDPNAFEAGTTASAAASTTAPAIDSSAATTADATDAGDGLAPLETGKPHVAAATGGGGGGVAKPKADPPECVQARHFCNELPPAERGKGPNQKACSDNKFACFNKGGHL